jgi:hypothetical protein
MGCNESKATMNEAKSKQPTVISDPAKDPAAVLASASEARTLTISDQHANILLTTKSKDNKKALLKLTLVPFHKTELAPLHRVDEEEECNLSEEDLNVKKDIRAKEENEHSSKVMDLIGE